MRLSHVTDNTTHLQWYGGIATCDVVNYNLPGVTKLRYFKNVAFVRRQKTDTLHVVP